MSWRLKMINRYGWLKLFIAMIFFGLYQNVCAKEGRLTLDKTIQIVLNTNPQILVKRAEERAIKQRIDQEAAGYLPKIDLQAGGGWERFKENIKPNKLSTVNFPIKGTVPTTRSNIGATLTQKLFDGFETPNRVDKARKETFQSKKSAEEAQILTSFEATQHYISVRRFERLVKISKENVAVHQDILSKVKQQSDAGKATVADRSLVEARLDDAEAAVSDIQGDLDSAVGNFIEVVGVEPKNLAKVDIDQSKLPKSLEDAIQYAICNNRTVKVALASIEVAKADLEVTRAPFMPGLDFQADAHRNRNFQGENGSITDISGQLVARFNVFNGGRDLAKFHEYKQRVVVAKHKINQERRKAEKEVRVSYAQLISARAQAAALRKAVAAKQKVRDTYLSQFKAGQRSFIDILDASHEYFLAKGSLITADATEDLASLRLLTAMNKFFDLFGINDVADPCIQPVKCAP